MYRKLLNTSIIRINDGASIPADPLNSDYREYLLWAEAGGVPTPYSPPALTIYDYIETAQAHLDNLAKSWGYDDLKSACTYLGDPYPRFAAEALALRNWRSAVWAYLDSISSSPLPNPLPIKEEFILLLPTAPARPVV